ncbi:two-partner secretion domain-containing protein [Acaryochloris marina NIES-2412]|uniref:two-partner secretion domain-containing protein n=1 Tax=Acaryochloris marina TaxID=155978 RepID=UPI0040588C9F
MNILNPVSYKFNKYLLTISGLILSSTQLFNPAFSQIVPDTSLPGNLSIITPSAIKGTPIKRIDGGLKIGQNKFHSFLEFNNANGESIYFSNPSQVANILVRVTGSNISVINGKLGVLGNADLFFLNPNGILFGGGSHLDISGSFIASTARNILFSDGSFFGNENLLTFPSSNAKITGIKLDNNSRDITILGNGHNLSPASSENVGAPLDRSNINGLEPGKSRTIGFFARNLIFDGGVVTSQSGNIEIGSIKEGTINLNKYKERWLLSYKNISPLGNISFLNQSFVESRGSGDNSVSIYGNKITVDSGSLIAIENSGIFANTDTLFKNVLNIYASDELIVKGISQDDNPLSSGIIATSRDASGGADIQISALSLTLEEGGGIASTTFGTGAGSDIDISTIEGVKISSSPVLAPGVNSFITSTTFSLGRGGNIRLRSRDLILSKGGSIGTGTFSNASAGNVDVYTQGDIRLTGFAPLVPPLSPLNPVSSNINSATFSSGSGGNLNISAESLLVENGGTVGASSFSSGNTGDISINVRKSLKVFGISPPLSLPSVIGISLFGSGNSGTLKLRAMDLRIEDGGLVGSSNFGNGATGPIDIETTGSITISGSYSTFLPSTIGSATISANPQLKSLFNLPDIPSGQSAAILINTPLLTVKNGGRISVQNDGPDDAGNLSINADRINIDNASLLATAFGNGGNIEINANFFSLNNGAISATTQGNGTGGNIDIDTDLLVGFGGNDITANAVKDSGGNIRIDTVGLFLSPGTNITATSEAGLLLDGTVTLNTQRTGAEETTAPAPDLETSPEVVSACNPSTGPSRFVMMGPGGLKVEPEHPVLGDSRWEISKLQLASQPQTVQGTEEKSMVEATGWEKRNDKLVLVAKHQNQVNSTASKPATCDKT